MMGRGSQPSAAPCPVEPLGKDPVKGPWRSILAVLRPPDDPSFELGPVLAAFAAVLALRWPLREPAGTEADANATGRPPGPDPEMELARTYIP